MGTIMWFLFIGAVIGGIAAIGLFIAGFALELVNCGCGILACDCDRSMIFDWSGMWGFLFVFVVGGAIIGLFYGIYKAKEERDEETAKINAENSEKARLQRTRWADTIKEKALGVANQCSLNLSINQSVVSTTYKADTEMEEVISELLKIAELQGTVDSLIEELS